MFILSLQFLLNRVTAVQWLPSLLLLTSLLLLIFPMLLTGLLLLLDPCGCWPLLFVPCHVVGVPALDGIPTVASIPAVAMFLLLLAILCCCRPCSGWSVKKSNILDYYAIRLFLIVISAGCIPFPLPAVCGRAGSTPF
jgi:hypothetical protein